jgi:hypothetical protein
MYSGMKKALTRQHLETIWWLAAFSVAAGLMIATFLLPGGGDLYEYYQPFEYGCLNCGYVPPFAQWFLLPLLVPAPFTWPVWTLVSTIGFLVIARRTKVNPFLLMVSLPMLAQLWGGQIDIIIVAGLLLLLRERSPYVRGLGVVMALVKPQLSFLALFFLLLQEKRQTLWKILLPPLLLLGLSFVFYGTRWPLTWLQNAVTLPPHPRRQASADIWPLGIFLIWVPLLFRQPDRRFIASLLLGSISTPFLSLYSYVIFLVFHLPLWAVPVSYAWLLFLPWFGVEANRFAWILPLSILFSLILHELQERRSHSLIEQAHA